MPYSYRHSGGHGLHHMRRLISCIAIALGVCGSAWLTLRADSQHIDVSVSTPRADIRMSVSDGIASFEPAREPGATLSILTDAGKPALPMRVVNVLLPPGRRV